MHCYDCALHHQETSAVAVCTTCGAGVCVGHARLRPEHLRLERGLGRSTSDTAARRISCPVCHTARFGDTADGSGRNSAEHDPGRAPATSYGR